MTLPVLTDRLALRWPVESDFDALCTLWTDPRVAQFMDDWGPRDIPGVRAWLNTHANAASDNGTHLQLVITRRTDAEVVGWLGLGQSDNPIAAWSFGYAIHPTHRANGYATEALAYCRHHLAVDSLWGECHAPNNASAHVMLTAGLRELPHPPKNTRRFQTP
ncbi:GNAT family N-acetyltransferase [Kribbella sp. NPDC004875]|uniref:GNAT family N-acetyltransferase n=1 Tax=Kribbella sp. NPDC004875 TaxID=3364107 RepID=UPI0036D031FB